MSGVIEEMHREEKAIRWDLLAEEVGVWGESLSNVVSDLKKREILGIKKYGQALSSNTKDDMLQHLYEELLDAAMYIRTLIEQRKKQ